MPEAVEPLVVEPKATAVVQASTVESEVAFLRNQRTSRRSPHRWRCMLGQRIWSHWLLSQRLPLSSRYRRWNQKSPFFRRGAEAAPQEASVKMEVAVSSWKQRLSQRSSSEAVVHGCRCGARVASVQGVAVEVRFNDQADKDPMCSYTSMSTCQAAWQSLLSVRSSSSLAALVAEQAPCLLTLEDITSLPPVHALSYAATAPVVVYIACYRSVRDGCTSGRLEISVQVLWRIWATSLEDHSPFVSSRHVASTLSPCFCRNTLVKTHFAAPSLRPHC